MSLVIEKTPPYIIEAYDSFRPFDPEDMSNMTYADAGRYRFRKALDKFIECRKTGEWHGYSEKINPMEVPRYEIKNMEKENNMANNLQVISDTLRSPQTLRRVALAIGETDEAQTQSKRYAASVLAELEKMALDPKKSQILNCSAQSIAQTMIDAAKFRLMIDGRQHAHIVQYGANATLQLGYRAYLYKVKRLIQMPILPFARFMMARRFRSRTRTEIRPMLLKARLTLLTFRNPI